MNSDKKIVVFLAGFILVGVMVTVFFPKEREKNGDAVIRIGAGDDISGVLMNETVDELSGKDTIAETMESSSFKDC